MDFHLLEIQAQVSNTDYGLSKPAPIVYKLAAYKKCSLFQH